MQWRSSAQTRDDCLSFWRDSREGSKTAARLQQGESWAGQLRTDDWEGHSVSTWQLFNDALNAGRNEEAARLIAHIRDNEMGFVHRAITQTPSSLLDHIARTWGEEEIGNTWRAVANSSVKKALRDSHHPKSVEEAVLIDVQLQRGHLCGRSGLGDLTVKEEEDRYVVTLDPCGTGGRLRKTGNFSVTTRGYPWSWGRKNVSYHCVLCCMYHEILSIEEVGYPFKVHEGIDDPGAACLHVFYKHPDLIPERYFTRVGKKMEPCRWRGSVPPLKAINNLGQ